MADAGAKVGIVIDATDKTTPAFKSATKGADRLTARFNKLGPSIRKGLGALPDAAGKASAAMLLLQSSTSQMGGKVADVVNKLGAVVALMAVGGPLGVALGAITLAVGTLTSVWGAFNDRMKSTNAVMEAVGGVAKRFQGELLTQASRVMALEEALGNMGRTAHEVQVRGIQVMINNLQTNLPLLEKELTLTDLGNRSKVASGKITQKQADEDMRLRQIAFNSAKAKLPLLERELEALEIMEFTRKDNEAAEKERARKEAERAKAREERARKLAEIEAAIARQRQELAMEAQRDRDAFRAHEEMERQAEFNNNTRRFEEQKAREVQALRDEEQREKESAELKIALAQKAADISMSLARGVTAVAKAEDDKAKKDAIVNLVNTAQVEIGVAAVAAAAKAFKAYQDIPWLGPLIGGAAAASAFATTLAFRKLLTGSFFAQGGLVTGGTPGKDSVAAFLRPGERVVTPEQQQDGRFGMGGGGGVTVNANFSLLKPDATTARRLAKDIQKEIMRGQRLGVVGAG